MLLQAPSALTELYEEDYLLWLEKNIKYLRDKNLNLIDYENLIEELETLGRSEKRAVESLLKQLLIHLLLYQYWTTEHQRNAHHLAGEIASFRDQLKRDLKSKTLYNYALSELDSLYESSVIIAKAKSNLNFPNQCPYTFAQLLDQNWLPFISE
ncbi:MAG TPA: DUF29 domain-containing protein [Allocoleopsis sp.]